MQTALDAVPYMNDAYKQKLRPYVEKYKDYIEALRHAEPLRSAHRTGQLGRCEHGA